MSSIPITGSNSTIYSVDTDTVNATETQVMKLRFGDQGIDENLVSSNNPLPVNAMQDLYMLFDRLISAVASPPWIDKSSNTIRNSVQSGTVTTVTTVGTVSTITNIPIIDSYQGKILMIGTSVNTWANTVRRTIS